MQANATSRVKGFDVARALAVFGMVVVNFKIAQEATSGDPMLLNLAASLEGRAAALFVILAGIGISFLSRGAVDTADSQALRGVRVSLFKRGLLLIVLGLAFVPIWPADILHFYGFYFLLAAGVVTWQNQRLLWLVVAVVFAFPLLLLLFDYSHGWNWDTLDYHGFWTFDGMFRHIFFNGFHPVIPWVGFLLFGLWFGRQNLSAGQRRRQLFATAFALWLATETVFNWWRAVFFNPQDWQISAEEANFLFSTQVIPPMPQYLLAAGSMAVMVTIGCLVLAERFGDSWPVDALYKTGQMALTLYVLHVLLGMGLMEATGHLGGQKIGESLLWSLGYCSFAVVFSLVWLSRLRHGPLEWMFKKLVAKTI